MFEYDYEAMIAAKKLDEYDFTEILSECYDAGRRDSWDIRNIIETRYKELEIDLGNLSTDEFMEYLSTRYPIKFEEVIKYRMWYTK